MARVKYSGPKSPAPPARRLPGTRLLDADPLLSRRTEHSPSVRASSPSSSSSSPLSSSIELGVQAEAEAAAATAPVPATTAADPDAQRQEARRRLHSSVRQSLHNASTDPSSIAAAPRASTNTRTNRRGGTRRSIRSRHNLPRPPMLRRGNRRGIGLPQTQPLPPRPSPATLNDQPTMTVQRQRMDAFMGQLLADGGRVATRMDAQRYLRRWDWEVDEAVTEWMREHREEEGIDVEDFEVEEMSVTESEDEGERGRERRRSFRGPTGRTGEEERRDAAAFLIRRLRVVMSDPRLTLTRYESLALLYHFQFDIDAATEHYRAQDGDVSEITDPWRPLRRRAATQRQRDERLALYISITQTNDWYTALMLLEQVGWDLAEALYLWHDAGEGEAIEPVPHPSTLIPGWGSAHEKRQRMGWRVRVDGAVWKDNKGKGQTTGKVRGNQKAQQKGKTRTERLFQEEEIMDPNATDSEDEASAPPREYNPQHSHEGAIVNVSARGPGRNPHLHAPDPGWLSIEVIRDGEYRFRPYNRYRFTSPPPPGRPAVQEDDGDDDETDNEEGSARRASGSGGRKSMKPPKEDFSWSNPDHIHNLTIWRRQALSRLVMGPAGTSTSATIPTQPSPATHHIPSARAPTSGIPSGSGLMGHGKPPAWTPEEEDFLYDLHEQYRNELLAEDPHRFDSDPHMSLPASKKAEWVERMNRHFDYERQGRPKKTEKSLVAKRGRMPRICERFGVKESVIHPEGGQRKRGAGVEGGAERKKKQKKGKGKAKAKGKGGERRAEGEGEGEGGEERGESEEE